MASSETAIVNIALSHIGSTAITGLTERNPKAIICKQFYDQAVDDVLRAYQWSCAIRRQQLAAVSGDISPYTYRYQLPESPYCLRVISVFYPETGSDLSSDKYIIEGRSLLTNASPLSVKYIAKVDDVSTYDALLTVALSYKLAAYLAYPITKKTSLRSEMVQLYMLTLADAKAATGIEAESPDELPTPWGDIV